MKHIFHYAIIPLLLLATVCVKAQILTVKDNHISLSERDFVLSGFKKITKPVNGDPYTYSAVDLHLVASYYSQDQSLKIRIPRYNDSITLSSPLNYQSLQIKLSDIIYKHATADGTVDSVMIEDRAVLEVFYWLVGITDNIKSDVLAGTLYLNKGTIVSNGNDGSSYEDREKKRTQLERKLVLEMRKLDSTRDANKKALQKEIDSTVLKLIEIDTLKSVKQIGNSISITRNEFSKFLEGKGLKAEVESLVTKKLIGNLNLRDSVVIPFEQFKK